MIGIRLLPTIGSLQPVSYDMNVFQSLKNQLGTKNQWLTHFKPSNRSPIPPTIQGFIGSHENGLMKTIIIRKLHDIPWFHGIINTFALSLVCPKAFFLLILI